MINSHMLDVLHEHFPQLPKKQLEICTLYSLGASYETIAISCNVSVETVRAYLKRSVQKLKLDGHEALRTAILLQAFLVMINK